MMNLLKYGLVSIVILIGMIGCSRSSSNSSEAKAPVDPGPDNTVTRYYAGVAAAPAKAQVAADKANEAIRQEQQQIPSDLP